MKRAALLRGVGRINIEQGPKKSETIWILIRMIKVDTIHDFETLIVPPPPGNAVVPVQAHALARNQPPTFARGPDSGDPSSTGTIGLAAVLVKLLVALATGVRP
jgi:hypothetical protein